MIHVIVGRLTDLASDLQAKETEEYGETEQASELQGLSLRARDFR